MISAGIPPFGRTAPPPAKCKACQRPLSRSPVPVIDNGTVLVQWTCRECSAVAVQEVGELDYSRAELQGEPDVWSAEERMRNDG